MNTEPREGDQVAWIYNEDMNNWQFVNMTITGPEGERCVYVEINANDVAGDLAVELIASHLEEVSDAVASLALQAPWLDPKEVVAKE